MAKKDYHKWSKDKLVHEIKTLLKRKKFGLVWEDQEEDVATKCEDFLPVLSKVKKKNIKNDKNDLQHILIEGDNYHALSTLCYTHKKKIDVIYIDPPYNKGTKDFMYNDVWVDEKNGRYKTHIHSTWLSFMEKRLSLAKRLLKDEGMIFVSIDEIEFAHLKVLMDDIFGADNFINCVVVKTKSGAGASGGGEDKKLKKNVEYLMFYAKNRSSFSYNPVFIERNLMDIIEEKREKGKRFEYQSILSDYGEKKLLKTIKDGKGDNIKIYKHTKYKIDTVSKIIKKEKITEKEVYLKYLKTFFAYNQRNRQYGRG